MNKGLSNLPTRREEAQRQRGFTLIEVLVAVSILAITLLGILHATSTAISSQQAVRLRVLASWVAENRIANHQLLRYWPNIGETEGKETMGGEQFFWRETVSSTPNIYFRRLDVTVLGSEGNLLASLSGVLSKQ